MRVLRYDWRALFYWAATIGGITYTLAALLPVPFGPDVHLFLDLHAYWALDLGDLYGRGVGTEDAFLYSPAAALGFWPVTLLPFWVVAAMWVVANIGLVLWLRAGPLLLLWPMPDPILVGNVTILYAALIVLGMRWPGAWAFMALTKITPAVGALWYAGRGEWRSFGAALGVTLLLAAVSLLVLPEAWLQWGELLIENLGADTGRGHSYHIPLLLRLPLALLVVFYAGRTDRAWLLPFGVFLALPVVWYSSFAVLMAVPRLWRRRVAD